MATKRTGRRQSTITKGRAQPGARQPYTGNGRNRPGAAQGKGQGGSGGT